MKKRAESGERAKDRAKEARAKKAKPEPEHNPDLDKLEKSLGHAFGSRKHLSHALVHKSWVNEQKLPAHESNERLEFLGDSVLDLVVSQAIMKRFPEYAEGQLSKLRASIVNEQKLSAIARKLDLGSYLYFGKGEERSGGREKRSILADAYEAVLAAVYVDGGLEAADAMVKRHFRDALKKVPEERGDRDFKTRLQEECQGRMKVTPEYRLMGTSGPDHRKVFTVGLSISGKKMSEGSGRTKKQAEQRAAALALGKLRAAKAPARKPARKTRKS
ncbi:MAG: ribonuclease III [Myxococcota bacterium]